MGIDWKRVREHLAGNGNVLYLHCGQYKNTCLYQKSSICTLKNGCISLYVNVTPIRFILKIVVEMQGEERG